MNKENYFGMYIGQFFILNDKPKNKFKLRGVTVPFRKDKEPKVSGYTSGMDFSYPVSGCSLILRTFEDMTEEEMNKLRELNNSKPIEYTLAKSCEDAAMLYEYLISIGIDVFGLIEKGYAIRESEVK